MTRLPYPFQQALFHPILRMMNRGIRIDTASRGVFQKELLAAQIDKQELLNSLIGHPLNPKSPAQLIKFFYTDLGLPGVKNLLTETLTTNSPTMALIAEKEPLLKPLCQLIVELRSIQVFLSTFVDAKLDFDGRMRSGFIIPGTATYRLASRENAFNSGMNFQNIPVAAKEKIKSANYVKLPNIRKLFLPDPDYTFFDMDLDRADLQVVVWEADDSDLKKALHLGLDMHCLNAVTIFDIKNIPPEELAESHPNYKERRAQIGETPRAKAKAGIHATNYGIGSRKLASTLGITISEAEHFQTKWFSAHPGIRKWHQRIEHSARTRGFIENAFKMRFQILGRIDLPELLAWGPQSTVARVINEALIAIDSAEQSGETDIQLLIQVHDSLAGQFPTLKSEKALSDLRKLAAIPIPYDDPLIIPVGIKTSTESWGACK